MGACKSKEPDNENQQQPGTNDSDSDDEEVQPRRKGSQWVTHQAEEGNGIYAEGVQGEPDWVQKESKQRLKLPVGHRKKGTGSNPLLPSCVQRVARNSEPGCAAVWGDEFADDDVGPSPKVAVRQQPTNDSDFDYGAADKKTGPVAGGGDVFNVGGDVFIDQPGRHHRPPPVELNAAEYWD